MQSISSYPYSFDIGKREDKWVIDVYKYPTIMADDLSYVGTVFTDQYDCMDSTDCLVKKEEANCMTTQLVSEEIREAFQAAMERYEEDRLRECLDEVYEEVKIGCCSFSPSRIVEELDPIAFRCMISEEREHTAESLGDYEGVWDDNWYILYSKDEEEWGVNGSYFKTFRVGEGKVYHWNEASDCYCLETDEAVIRQVLAKVTDRQI